MLNPYLKNNIIAVIVHSVIVLTAIIIEQIEKTNIPADESYLLGMILVVFFPAVYIICGFFMKQTKYPFLSVTFLTVVLTILFLTAISEYGGHGGIWYYMYVNPTAFLIPPVSALVYIYPLIPALLICLGMLIRRILDLLRN